MENFEGLHVCFISGTLGQGGAERQLCLMCKALIGAGATVTVITLSRGEYWEHPIRELGAKVIWAGRLRGFIARLLTIIKVVRRISPDILQSQQFYTNLYVGIASRTLNIPSIGALRSNLAYESSFYSTFTAALALRLPHHICANSKNAILNAKSKGIREGRLSYLPNIIDVLHFAPIEESEASDVITIVTAGNFTFVKRMDRFLRVFSRLRTKVGARVRALMVGDGPLRMAIEQEAKQKHLDEIIEFPGRVPDIKTQLQRADIFVMTSDAEGMPNVILEAMAMELPVVAARVGGIPEIVNDGKSGYLVSPSDEEAMTNQINVLVRNKQLRIDFGKAGREYVMEHHTQDYAVGRLRAIYETYI